MDKSYPSKIPHNVSTNNSETNQKTTTSTRSHHKRKNTCPTAKNQSTKIKHKNPYFLYNGTTTLLPELHLIPPDITEEIQKGPPKQQVLTPPQPVQHINPVNDATSADQQK